MIIIPPVPILTPYSFQSVSDVKEVISTNDATIQGILLGVILALGGALVYLYIQKNKREEKHQDEIKELHIKYQEDIRKLHEKYQGDAKALNERFIDEVRKMNDKLIDVNNTNFQTIQMIEKMNR